jgi:hypothetical protein
MQKMTLFDGTGWLQTPKNLQKKMQELQWAT